MALSDTDPKAKALQLQMLRDVPVWRKVALWAELNATARALALSGLRARYPRADEAELRRRLADVLLGPELATRVYGPLPERPYDS